MIHSEEQIAYLQQAAAELKDYLFSAVLSWPLGGRPVDQRALGLDTLTLGNVLLIKRRLQNQPEAAQICQSIADVRAQWLENWRRKAGAEYGVEFRLWKNYLADLTDGGNPAPTAFIYHLRRRTILELLDADAAAGLVEKTALKALDERFKNLTRAGDFVWELELKDCFPTPPFWFLYRSISH